MFPGAAAQGHGAGDVPLKPERAMPVMPPDAGSSSRFDMGPSSYAPPAATPAPAPEEEEDVPWVDIKTPPRREREPINPYVRPEAGAPPFDDKPLPKPSPLKALLGNRVALLIVLGVVLAVAVASLLMRPRSEGGLQTTSVADIRRNARAYDGREVTVSGRVGQVFQVGQGHTFYLHQGRDTLVVFTRGAAPAALANVTIKGSISTGEMDGIPRPTLFQRAE